LTFLHHSSNSPRQSRRQETRRRKRASVIPSRLARTDTTLSLLIYSPHFLSLTGTQPGRSFFIVFHLSSFSWCWAPYKSHRGGAAASIRTILSNKRCSSQRPASRTLSNIPNWGSKQSPPSSTRPPPYERAISDDELCCRATLLNDHSLKHNTQSEFPVCGVRVRDETIRGWRTPHVRGKVQVQSRTVPTKCARGGYGPASLLLLLQTTPSTVIFHPSSTASAALRKGQLFIDLGQKTLLGIKHLHPLVLRQI
jgi:hypothetical protein